MAHSHLDAAAGMQNNPELSQTSECELMAGVLVPRRVSQFNELALILEATGKTASTDWE